MKNLFALILLIFTITFGVQAQYSEDFENGYSDWTITNADDNVGSWTHGTSGTVNSQYWNPPSHSQFMNVNDDAPGANNNTSGLLTGNVDIDLSGMSNPVFAFAAYFINGDYGGDEVGAALISTDGGANWTAVHEVPGDNSGWQNVYVPLDAYAGQTIRVGFSYDDGNSWNYGFSVDDVAVFNFPDLDAELTSAANKAFGLIDEPFIIKGEFFNFGNTTITSVDVTYTINGQNPVTATIDNLNVPSFSYYEFEHPTPWVPQAEGDHTIALKIDDVNGSTDDNPANNELEHELTIYENTIVPNIIDDFANGIPVFTEIGNSGDQLDAPTDLDFHPVLGLYQLWVINQRIESTGGSTVTYYDAGKGNQTSEQRVDGNAWHFMSLPTALAFGDAGDWASSTGVKDANHSGGTFTGPTLWSSDPEIYAQPSGGNGSHLDMLHGSPYSMGIAHEVDNAYWVFDGWNEHIVRYDFKEDHGPGNDDHADGEVRRFTEITVEKDGDIPSHLILDKETGWLYIVDNGNDRILRLDINSTTLINPSLPLINEPLAVHASMDADWEIIISGFDQPCGIEIIENRLLVSDYATGDIIIYDIDNDFAEIDRIITGEAGITGIKIGPEGNIWYTNRITNKVMMVAPAEPVSVDNLEEVYPISIAPNPTNGLININLPGNTTGDLFYKVMNATGQQIRTGQFTNTFETLDLATFHNGMYFINIYNDTHTTTKKVILNK